jgi:ElaB/YqjD/DUF883 family membrane-anchored ribosome-binding protein
MNNAAPETTKPNHASSILDSVLDSIGGGFLKSRVDTLTNQAKKQGFMTIFKTKQYVEKNPFQSLAIAFGVGYVLKTLKPGVLVTTALVGGALYGGQKIGLK